MLPFKIYFKNKNPIPKHVNLNIFILSEDLNYLEKGQVSLLQFVAFSKLRSLLEHSLSL